MIELERLIKDIGKNVLRGTIDVARVNIFWPRVYDESGDDAVHGRIITPLIDGALGAYITSKMYSDPQQICVGGLLGYFYGFVASIFGLGVKDTIKYIKEEYGNKKPKKDNL